MPSSETDRDLLELLSREPLLPIDRKPAPLAYDGEITLRHFSEQLPAMRAESPHRVIVPNVDCSAAAAVAIGAVLAARHPVRAARLSLATSVLEGDTVDELEARAHALFFIAARQLSAAATTDRKRFGIDLLNRAREARARVLQLLEFELCDDFPGMDLELADIRRGKSAIDLASDLQRLKSHMGAHREQLARSTKFRPGDEELLGRLVHELALPKDPPDRAVVDLRNRAYSRLVRTYEKVRLAARLVFFDTPAHMAPFPKLRRAVLELTSAGNPKRAKRAERGMDAPRRALSPPAVKPTGEGEDR